MDRTAYNLSAAQSGNDQLLLNLLRLREGEAVYMLELTSVLSQFELNTHAQFGGWWNNIDRINNNAVNAYFGLDTFATRESNWGVNAGFIERPTITYTPLQGERFAARFMQAIPIPTLLSLVESGWRIDRIFDCCVQRVNDLTNVPLVDFPEEGKMRHADFFELTRLLAERQRSGVLRFDLEREDKEVYLVPGPVPSGADTTRARLAELLGLPADTQRAKLVAQSLHGPDEIAVQTRSLLGVMQALARECSACDGAPLPEDSDAASGQPWLAIHNSAMPVRDAYVQVRHGGRWYSIANSDRRSKRTFALVVYLTSLRATDIAGAVPVVTVPSH